MLSVTYSFPWLLKQIFEDLNFNQQEEKYQAILFFLMVIIGGILTSVLIYKLNKSFKGVFITFLMLDALSVIGL